MARTNLIKLAFVIALTMAAGSAYGAASQICAATQIGAGSFVPSNNVTIGVSSSDTMFSANSKHKNGDRLIAMFSGDAKLYYSTVTASIGSTCAAPAASNTYSALSSTAGWTSM